MDTYSNSCNDIFPAQSKSEELSLNTETERISSVSITNTSQNVSFIKTVKVEPPEPKRRSSSAYVSEAVINHEETHSTTDSFSAAANNDEFLSSVFEGINLPDVSFAQDPQRAIKQIDDVLAKEDNDYHYDDSSLVTECQHFSTTPYQHMANPHNSSTEVNSVSDSAVESPMDEAMENLHLSEDERGENVGIKKAEMVYGQHDTCSVSKPRLPSFREECDVNRQRSMTVDSSVSHAESRTGGFDVHSDNGHFTAEEINLHHDEVAYIRPESVTNSSDSIPLDPIKSFTVEMKETLRLRQLNSEVAEAQERQKVLTEQVERERAEVQRLRLLKQHSIAREPAATVLPLQRSAASGRNVVSIHTNKGSLSDSSEKLTISPNPCQRSSIDSIYEEEIVTISPLAQHQLKNGNTIGTVENVDLVVPENHIVKEFSSNPQILKVIVGGHQKPTDEDKTVLLFGPVGSGKTSTISSMLNYLYDVKKENNFRFILDYPMKKTTTLTVYVINNTILPFSVTIVDTPGIVDESGNKIVSTLIKKWFEKELREAGTFRLDAISLVLSHNENSLGWPFIHELASVKHMLGDDLKTNVLPIITNSEVLPQPIAIRSLAQANIAFLEYYKCNNLGFMPNVNGIPKLQHNLFFTHGVASLEAYFRDLQEMVHPLLAVLRSATHSPSLHSPLY